MSALPHDEYTIDRLCEHATRGLEDPSAIGVNDAALIEQFELAAAALGVALVGEPEPMPRNVRAALSAAAREHESPKLRLAGTPATPRKRGNISGATALGWIAAAACLTIAVYAWMNPRPPARPSAPSIAAQYDALAACPGVVRASWVGLDDLLGVPAHAYDEELAGEIIWDHDSQTGFMKFTGLAANEPDEFQYQLWIFDAERRVGDLPQFAIEGLPDLLTQRPVDGGVFDAATLARTNTPGEIIIPIDAKLPVGNAAIFAITVEPPGGVVVSDRDIVTAAIAG